MKVVFENSISQGIDFASVVHFRIIEDTKPVGHNHVVVNEKVLVLVVVKKRIRNSTVVERLVKDIEIRNYVGKNISSIKDQKVHVLFVNFN